MKLSTKWAILALARSVIAEPIPAPSGKYNVGVRRHVIDPLTREPTRVAVDVRAGLVSVEAAAADYGVVVSAAGEVDEPATTARRAELGNARGSVEPGGFDFGPLAGREELSARIADERREFDAWMAAESRTAR